MAASDEPPGEGRSPARLIRPLVTSDLDDLARIERDAYPPELRESEAAVLSKMALFRAGALGCFSGTELYGYAFALPWTSTRLVGVAQVLDALPADPDVMYVHDMVVAPGHRRQGVASELLAEIIRVADRLDLGRLLLVSVQDSEPFWERAGFRALDRFEYVPGVMATRMEMLRAGPPPPPPPA